MKKALLILLVWFFFNSISYAKKLNLSQINVNNKNDIQTIINHYSKKPDNWFVANNTFLIVFEDKKIHKDKLSHVSGKTKRVRPSKSKIINLKTGKVDEFPHYIGFPLKNNVYDIDAILFHDSSKNIKQSALFVFHDGSIKYMRARSIPRHIKDSVLMPCYNAKIFSSIYFYTSGSFFKYKGVTWGGLNHPGIQNEKWQPYGILNHCGVPLVAELSHKNSKIFLDPNTLAPIKNIEYPSYSFFGSLQSEYQEYSKMEDKMRRKALLALRPQMMSAKVVIDEQDKLFNIAYEQKTKQKQSKVYQSGRVAYQPQKQIVETEYTKCMFDAPQKTKLYYEIAYKSGAKPVDGTWTGTYRKLLEIEENRCERFK